MEALMKSIVHHPLRRPKLSGKTAIVTGSGRGIGQAIAALYAIEGANVVVASLGEDECRSAVEVITASGASAVGKPTNVAVREEIDEMVAFAIQTFGSLDILVNNAQSWGTPEQPAGMPVPVPIEQFDEAELEWTFDTGFRGTWWAMRAAFPHLRDSGQGRVINFGSWYGQMGNQGTVGYNVTKEAIRALSRTAAREWAPHGITVNVITPAAKTEAAEQIARTNPDAMAAALATIPMGRLGDPHTEVAPAALFLASDEAKYITGQTLGVDGGVFLHP
jgi:NAD(P)-dependent dehydrogenase (short-subunit alcohol dehydrogenase family)